MWEAARAFVQQEIVAAVGFFGIWVVASVAVIIGCLKIRSSRKERVVQLLSDAKLLATEAMFRYTKLCGLIDREIVEKAEQDRKPIAGYMKTREEYGSRREAVVGLEARVAKMDVEDGSHKSLLAALAVKSEAEFSLMESEQLLDLLSSFPAKPENFQSQGSSVVQSISEELLQSVSDLRRVLELQTGLIGKILAAFVDAPG